MHTYKSAEVAGILGIVLGGIGAMDFYLENYRKVAVHVGLLMLSLALIVVDVLVLPLACATADDFAGCAGLRVMLEVATTGIILGNFLWGVVEGIVILIRGDDGLAQKGHWISNSRIHAKDARSVSVVEEQAAKNDIMGV